MASIILLETSAALCSVALVKDGIVVGSRISSGVREHAAMTAVFVKQILDENNLKVGDCDAVCVNAGPGSYTGLRVGSSTAKGLCFGGGIPLLSTTSTDILVSAAIKSGAAKDCRYIVPMVDARRMEVYCATYGSDGTLITGTRPIVVDAHSFDDLLSEGRVLMTGDGAPKVVSMLKDCLDEETASRIGYLELVPMAEYMADGAVRAYEEKRFEDIAYFEPLYVKEFVATVSATSFQVPR